MGTNKKLIVGGAIAGGLMLGAAALVIGVGLAHGESYGYEGDQSGREYARELWADGMDGTVAEATNLGETVCGKREQGFTEHTLIADSEKSFPVTIAVDVVMGGEYHFCPAYDDLHDEGSSAPDYSSTVYITRGGHHR
jgi:hypothetical protein